MEPENHLCQSVGGGTLPLQKAPLIPMAGQRRQQDQPQPHRQGGLEEFGMSGNPIHA